MRTALAVLAGVAIVASPPLPATELPIAADTDYCRGTNFQQPADDLLTAFERGKRFVFVGSTHGGLKRHRFLACVLSRPRAADLVTDVVAEFASASVQGALDRYLLELAEVPDEELARAWNDTMDLGVWARMPLPERFLREVRALNERLPREKRFRVLGGSSPIDWSRVRTTDDLARVPPKTNWLAHMILEELWPDAERRVLLAYGERHNHYSGGGVMGHLLRVIPRSATFVVGSVGRLDPEDEAELRRFGDPASPFLRQLDGSEGETSLDGLFYTHGRPVADSLDALLFLGPEPDESLRNTRQLSPQLAAEMGRRTSLLTEELIVLHGKYRDSWFKEDDGLSTGVPAHAQPDGDAEAQAAAEIADYLDRLEKLGFAGAVVIARDGRPLVADGYGLADRENGVPWSPSTITTIGSITKQLTGAAILALAEEGKLATSDTLADHFDAERFGELPEDKRAITLHQLLTHSSGIVDVRGLGDWDPIERDEYVRRALAQELVFTPGEGYEYSNAGFSLLAAIVEQVTGGSYEEFLRRRLFLPAGMYETGYVLAGWDARRLAVGYRDGQRWGTVLERPLADDGPYWALRGNGGIHATAWDMLRWGQALLAGRVLSPESMERYWSPHVDEGGGDSFYGYGWVVMDLGGAKVITHNGGNSIFFADMALVPDTGLVIFYATNVVAEMPVAGGLLEPIGMRLAAGQPLPEVPERAERSAEELAALAGQYALAPQDRGEAGAIAGGRVEVAVGGGALRIVPRDPLAFSRLLSQCPVDPARADRLSARTDAVVGALVAGNAEPLARAYRREVTAEALADRWQSTRQRLESMNGAFQGYRVLGTAFREARDVTLVRLQFENGHADRAYVWDPDEEESLRGVSLRGMDAELYVLPVTGGGWATWDGRTGESLPVAVETGENGWVEWKIGGEGGLVATLAEEDR